MLKVKEEYLLTKPHFTKLRLGEMSQKQLKKLPKDLQQLYCEVEKKKDKK